MSSQPLTTEGQPHALLDLVVGGCLQATGVLATADLYDVLDEDAFASLGSAPPNAGARTMAVR